VVHPVPSPRQTDTIFSDETQPDTPQNKTNNFLKCVTQWRKEFRAEGKYQLAQRVFLDCPLCNPQNSVSQQPAGSRGDWAGSSLTIPGTRARTHTATTHTRQQELASPLQMSANSCNILLLSISYSLESEKSQQTVSEELKVGKLVGFIVFLW